MKVLVVEDEPYIRQGIVEFLKEESFEIEESASVTEAMACLRQSSFDAVLCDNFLPDGEGMDILNSLQGASMPVILMTSFGNRDLVSQAFAAGAYDYVAKPIRFDELLARLARLEEKIHLRSKVEESEQALQQQGELAILGSSAVMLEVQHLIKKAGASKVPVIIQGETGVGKGVWLAFYTVSLATALSLLCGLTVLRYLQNF